MRAGCGCATGTPHPEGSLPTLAAPNALRVGCPQCARQPNRAGQLPPPRGVQVPEQSRSLLGDGVGSSTYIRYLTQAGPQSCPFPPGPAWAPASSQHAGAFSSTSLRYPEDSAPRLLRFGSAGQFLGSGEPLLPMAEPCLPPCLPPRLQTKAYSQILARIVAGQRKNRFVQEG